MKPPVLIIGSHRSGTSATVKALRSMGLFIGNGLNAEHDEATYFVWLHRSYMRKVGASWHRPQPLLEHLASEQGKRQCREYLACQIKRPTLAFYRYFGGFPQGVLMALRYPLNWGWKDPRTTLFAPVWLQIFPDARVLHMVRHPVDTALSLQHRELRHRSEGITPIPHLADLDSCFALVRQYVECAVEAAQFADRYREVRFEDVQDDPIGALQELADFCGLKPRRNQIQQAAEQIDTDRRRRWQRLPEEVVAHLMQEYPFTDRFDYRMRLDTEIIETAR